MFLANRPQKRIINNLKYYNPTLCDICDRDIWLNFLNIWDVLMIKLGWTDGINGDMLSSNREIFQKVEYDERGKIEVKFQHNPKTVSCITKAVIELQSECEPVKKLHIRNPGKTWMQGKDRWTLDLCCAESWLEGCFSFNPLAVNNSVLGGMVKCSLRELNEETGECDLPDNYDELAEPTNCCPQGSYMQEFQCADEIYIRLTYKAGYSEIPPNLYGLIVSLMEEGLCKGSCLDGGCENVDKIDPNAVLTGFSRDGENMTYTIPDNVVQETINSAIANGQLARMYQYSNNSYIDSFLTMEMCI